MKKLILVGLTAISTFLHGQKYVDMIDKGTFSVDQIEKSAEKHFDEVGRGKGTGYKQFQRWLYNAKRSRTNDGVLLSANEQLKSLRSYKRKHKDLEVPGFSTTATWENLGPEYKNGTSGWNPGVGRITSVGIDENNLSHYIVGGPNCGVWKTTNDGGNWTNLTDGFQDLNVWSLEISQHDADVYYWGSNSGDMFKSTNGGSTWVEVTFPGSGTIRKIAIHPNDPNIVFAAANDLYKSTNGGTTWTSVNTEAGYDIEFKPGDPTVVYYSGNKVYKSTNSGDSFTEVSGGFSTSETKMMAVTADNPNLILVLEERSGKFGGLYKSTNSGGSFTKIQTGSASVNNMFGYTSDGTDDRGQAPRDMDIIIDPTNENNVILAGIQCWKSMNGGTTFNINTYWTPSGAASRGVGYNHADVDILVWHPGKVFAGTDGGVYTSTNAGGDYVDKTTGISCREFYRIGVSKTDPNVVSGGSQDNGTSCMRGNLREWVCWLGADGMESFVDWSNPNKLYGTSQNGSMYKSTNQGNSRSGISKPTGSGAWVTPFEQDPIDASVIYVGFNEVWKSSDDGSNWTQISSFGGGTLDELKIAPTDNDYIYCADGSTLRVTKNGGTSWSTISPGGTINYIHVSPRDKNRVVAVTSSNVYISTDAGSSWTNFNKNLPNVSYYCAVWADNAENGLYVGGLGFVSYIEDGMTDYVDFWDGLPMCSVNELEINYVSNTIFAATYGRGLWESDLYGGTPLQHDVAVSNISNVPSSLCGSSVSPTVEIENKGTETLTDVVITVTLNGSVIESIAHNTNLAQGETEVVVLSQVTYGTAGNNDLKIVVSDPNGELDEKSTNDEVSTATNVEFGTAHLFYIDERSASNTMAWYISEDGGSIIKSGTYGSASLVSTELQESVCIPEGCYNFVISEAFNSGGCSTPAWNSSTVYYGDAGLGAGLGEVISHSGKEYRAQWWTQGNEPGTAGGNMWLEVGDCSVTYDTDVYGFKEAGENAYFEIEVQSYSSPQQDDFCFGSSLVVDFSADNQVVNHCNDVVFTANITGGTPTSYSWNFGADASPATAIGEGPHTIRYLTSGMKTVALTVDGTTESKSNYMMVGTDLSKAVSAEVLLNNSPSCVGDQMDFVASLDNEGSSPVFSWMVNGSEVGTLATFSSTALTNGDEVTLKVTSDDECSIPDEVVSSAYTVSLTDVVSPSVSIALTGGGSWPICIGDAINLTAVTQEGGVSESVSWKVNNADVGSSGTTFDFIGGNGDVITAVLNSSLECVDQNDVASNEITAVVDVCTSTEETEIVELSTYPNPVVDALTVVGSGIQNIVITEVSGKIVAQMNITDLNTVIDMSQYASGSYLVKVEYTSGNQEVLEIQKK